MEEEPFDPQGQVFPQICFTAYSSCSLSSIINVFFEKSTEYFYSKYEGRCGHFPQTGGYWSQKITPALRRACANSWSRWTEAPGLTHMHNSQASRLAHGSATHCFQWAELRIPRAQRWWPSPGEKDVQHPANSPPLKSLLNFWSESLKLYNFLHFWQFFPGCA